MTLGQFVQAEERIIMAEDYRPFQYIENGAWSGLSFEIVSEILKIIDQPSKINLYPWARAYSEIANKPNRILFSMARTADREHLFKWVGPIIEDKVFFYKKRSVKININDIADAKAVGTVLVVRNYPEHADLQKRLFTNLYIVNQPVQLFKMLVLERGDLVPSGEITVLPILQKANIDPHLIEQTNALLFENKLYIAFSKDTSDLEVLKWQQALNQLKSTGKYAQILNNYLPNFKQSK